MHQVDVFVQQLNFAERSGCWSRPYVGPSGTAAILRKRTIWPAKQQPFLHLVSPGGDLNLEAEAKGVAL
jgi:hypothetical protein